MNQPKPQLVVEPENITARLAAAADRASGALDTLAAIEQTRTPTDLPPLAANAPVELRRSITVNWVGPVEPIAKQLADRASYRFDVTGNPPETPVIVNLNVRNQPVIESLRDLGLQLGHRAELKVDPNLRVIELNYPNIQAGEDLVDKKPRGPKGASKAYGAQDRAPGGMGDMGRMGMKDYGSDDNAIGANKGTPDAKEIPVKDLGDEMADKDAN